MSTASLFCIEAPLDCCDEWLLAMDDMSDPDLAWPVALLPLPCHAFDSLLHLDVELLWVFKLLFPCCQLDFSTKDVQLEF